jgi:two-component system chemotaxis response regulator CheB
MNHQPTVIAIGASTGGLAALQRITRGLPAEFPAIVLIVMHVTAYGSALPEILSQYSALPVRHPTDGEAAQPGTIFVAPSDLHLVVQEGRIRLTRGPKENYSRPAIDALFRSAALAYHSRVTGVVLTGKLDDGTVGLQAIKAYGGIAIVQDPAEAEAPDMPRSALAHVNVDYCLTLDKIVKKLIELANQPPSRAGPDKESEVLHMENQFAISGAAPIPELDKVGTRSMFTCPECHGILWEIKGAKPARYRCHTGHAFTSSSLEAAQNMTTEEALWAAVRALHEKQTLSKHMADKAREDNRLEAATEHDAIARHAAQNAELLRKLITGT